MHERIKDIAVECIVETINDSWVFNDAELEMFAQLIVEECCDRVNRHQQHNNPNDCLLVLDIKEHFGIEK